MSSMTDKTADRSSLHTRSDTMRISEEERRHAYASLRKGELAAKLVLRAAADMRAIAQRMAHAAAGLASDIKAMLAKLVKH